ncbi:unnamed protein product [Haemonchus placei]|uniref:GRAS domain-containing protein n=1 Tax=Haemonchus placei TaxID=6290 RepID=A0A0N4W7M5_HAEPC|nr:unnamed protein product [Haemonchus placei]
MLQVAAVDLHFHAFPFHVTHDVLESCTEKFGLDGIGLSSPSPHVDDDFFVEWRDPGGEVVELTKHHHISSRNTMIPKRKHSNESCNGVAVIDCAEPLRNPTCPDSRQIER